jgi:hypothetical protein
MAPGRSSKAWRHAETRQQGRDGSENWLISKLVHELGQPAVGSFVEVSLESFDDIDVCRVDVKRATSRYT